MTSCYLLWRHIDQRNFNSKNCLIVHRNPFIFKIKRKCYTHKKDRASERPKFTLPTFIEICRKNLSKVKNISRHIIWQFFYSSSIKNIFSYVSKRPFGNKNMAIFWLEVAIFGLTIYRICFRKLWLLYWLHEEIQYLLFIIFFRWRKTQEPLVPHIYHKRR